MLTYPIPSSVLSGNATLVQVLAFLKSPTMLARRFDEILRDHNFLSHYLLRGRYPVVGGAIVYLPDETIDTDEGPETIAPGGEYPLVTLNADAPQIDGTVRLLPPQKASKTLKAGEFTKARVVAADGHDLVAQPL